MSTLEPSAAKAHSLSATFEFAPLLPRTRPNRLADLAKLQPEPAIEILKEQLRAAGLRSTGSRLAVLRVMRQAGSPLTHSEISARLERTGMEPPTIHRNLQDLTQSGVLARADLGDGVWRYEIREGTVDHRAKHPHFVCRDCGQVACLSDRAVSLHIVRGVPKALRQADLVVQIQGRCDACAAA